MNDGIKVGSGDVTHPPSAPQTTLWRAPSPTTILLGVSFLLPFVVYFTDPPRARQWIFGYELLWEAIAAGALYYRMLTGSPSRTHLHVSAGLSFSLLCLSLAQVPHASQGQLLSTADVFFLYSLIFYCLAFCGLVLVFVVLARGAGMDALYWVSAGSVMLSIYGVQYRYLLGDLGSLSSAASPAFIAFSHVYSVLGASAVAFAVLHAMRALDKSELALAGAVMLMFTVDFSTRHDIAYGRSDAVTFAQCLWASTGVSLCMLVFQNVRKKVNGSHPQPSTAEWMSVRVIFGICLFFVNVILLVMILVANLLTINNATHVTILLGLLFACWMFSNSLALKLSSDMRALLVRMPSVDSALKSGNVLPVVVARPISGRTLMSEIDNMIARYNSLVEHANGLVEKIVRDRRNEALVIQAQQVAHDIRSPLAAFNMALPELGSLPEESRVMLRNAIFRVQEIADSFLQSGQNRKISEGASEPAAVAEALMLSGLIESVVCEKRVQYRDEIDVKIENTSDAESYGLFANVSSREIKRVLSNLINNAVEAISSCGTVRVALCGDAETAYLTVEDDGPGIPDKVIAALGQRGLTVGKPKGNGLGLSHACEQARQWGGALTFKTPEAGGTIASLMLARALPPAWFLDVIELSGICRVVIVDDDLSIHGIWNDRFRKQDLAGISLIHLSTEKGFLAWCENNKERCDTTYILMDYEFLGSQTNGFQLLAKAPAFARRALVTSRSEDPQVLQQALRQGIAVVPKSVAAYVPIAETKHAAGTCTSTIDAILIDDDPLMHSVWRMAAKVHGKSLRCFAKPRDFLAVATEFPKKTPIYVDQNLGEGAMGTCFAKTLSGLAFSRIYIATGSDPSSIPESSSIFGVIGKEPPFAGIVARAALVHAKNRPAPKA